MGMLGYLFVGSHHDTGLPMGAEAAAGVERDQMADRQKAEIDSSAPFASVRAAVSMETAYRQAMHIPTTTLIFPPRLCWPPGSTCPIPQCRGTCFCSLEAQIPNFRCEICGICFVADSQSYLQMDGAGDYSEFYFIFGVLMTEDSYIGE
jgi:hypothetical protein